MQRDLRPTSRAASSPRLRAKGSQNKSADVSKTPSSPATELPVRNLEMT